jgi:hypothetical protein
VSHLTLGPIVNRRFDRFNKHQTAGHPRERHDVLGTIALKARFRERG